MRVARVTMGRAEGDRTMKGGVWSAMTVCGGRGGDGSGRSQTAPTRRGRCFRRCLGLAVGTILSLGIGPLSAAGAQNVLTWQDNSANEANFHIERTTAADVAACATATGWTQIVTTGANITAFTDAAVNEGVTYCYRVKASNPAGSSGYSNVAGRSVPFTIPAAPSGLTVGP